MSSDEIYDNNENNLNLFSKILTVIILVCICTLGVIGNLVVLIVAFRKRKYRHVTNCYIINLAITDLLFLLISVPLTAYLGLTNKWILNGFVSCRVHIYLAHVLLQATCYTLAAMSIDRYFYVASCLIKPPWRTPLNACIICVLIWAVSIAFVFPYTSLTSNTEGDINNCSVSAYHPFFASCFFPFCAYYVLPLIIIALCYTKLFLFMRNSSKKMFRRRLSLLNRPHIVARRRRITRTLLSLTFAFAICWLPIHTLEFLNCRQLLDEFYFRHSTLLDIFRLIAHALSYFNSCLNPFLYALFNKDFFR
ncbi:unnamed protein product [Adineta steineri]|uniref:G-protein coupled receptors family 1 profile domain-containing protein n=1 Tax=Adineta steineri TaxID=433720 RepID=A0A814N7R5_9BILA|nr:unnamed protein product [Adineta steineri]CAF1137955.1 unnamed protein product [Adineta steineri]CAF3581428.1 unnamed protein product [Adineta steineri]CAF3618774.1 unnamed protein product [Adineta steineri]